MLFLLFVLVPLIELALLIQVGQWIGLLPTILLVFVTGIAGAALARREGLRTLRRLQEEVASAQLPGDALLDGAAILLGGAFLLTPGVLTDLVGLSLLLPPTRALIKRLARRELKRRIEDGRIQVQVGGFGPAGGFGGGFGPSGFGPSGSGDGGEEEPPLDPRNEIRPRHDDDVS